MHKVKMIRDFIGGEKKKCFGATSPIATLNSVNLSRYGPFLCHNSPWDMLDP